jgi:electron transport complex protein RnfD
MQFKTSSGPFQNSDNSVSRIMRRVIYALIPGVLAQYLIFGPGVIVNIAIAVLTASMAESLVLTLRKRPILPALSDYSAVLTALLLAIALPTYAPFWITVFGTLFAIVIGKQLYGGIGYNPFNPAMLGYAVLLISFPRQMTAWQAPWEIAAQHPGLREAFEHIIGMHTLAADALGQATPLDHFKTQLGLAKSPDEIQSASIYAGLAGKGWQSVNLCYLVGGLWLLKKGVIGWQIPAGFLAGLFFPALIFYLLGAAHYPTPLFHLFSGATMLGAFFIATDPVSAATTVRGRLIYGVLAGVLVFTIRSWGGYPDGVAFAVLLMNLAAPTIDNYTRPRVYGHERA